jgi:hypothetical protein
LKDVSGDTRARVFVYSAALLVIAGIRVYGSDVEDLVPRNQAVGEVARRTALDIDAAERLNVLDDVVRDPGPIGAVHKNTTLHNGNDVTIHHRSIPHSPKYHSFAS